MLNGLDLFAGIGGISLALKPWVRTICYVEINPYCQAVLRTRIRAGDIDDADIWDDIRSFDPRPWANEVDIVTGGFPCQDISVAGKGAGLAGKRSGLFWQIIRVVWVVRPAFIFIENAPAITTPQRGGSMVVRALAALGYDARWGVLGAWDMGAPHQRDRWWILAHSNGSRKPQSKRGEQNQRRRTNNGGGALSHPNEPGLEIRQGQPIDDGEELAAPFETDWWAVEPNVGRVADGIPDRVDRLKGLGNAVVPACAREAFGRLMGMEL